MLSLVETSKQQAPRATCGSVENWQGGIFITDPLSTSIIHDLRNPLAAIYASAEMLTDLHLSPDHALRLGRNIYKAAGLMRELLADLTRVTQGKLASVEDCSLHEILAGACEYAAIAADKQGVDIFLALPVPMEVSIQRSRIKRVFINLITNALEAMPRGGTIRIAAKEVGGCALIRVQDTGPGIPPEIYGRLFDPFVTAEKKDGLGLGLALSRRTVRDHGGDMWIEPGDGARFAIRLPLSTTLAAFDETPLDQGPRDLDTSGVIGTSAAPTYGSPRPRRGGNKVLAGIGIHKEIQF